MTTAAVIVSSAPLRKWYHSRLNSAFIERSHPVPLHTVVIEQQPKFEVPSTLSLLAKWPCQLSSHGSCQDFPFLSLPQATWALSLPGNPSVGTWIGLGSEEILPLSLYLLGPSVWQLALLASDVNKVLDGASILSSFEFVEYFFMTPFYLLFRVSYLILLFN